MKKIAICTIATGPDRFYLDAVKRYLPYNKKNFGRGHEVDYLLFTDREEDVEGMKRIPCKTTIWPYCTMLKNNMIGEYMDDGDKWGEYDYIFFIDADFAIGEYYDFFQHNFILVDVYWGRNLGGGFFYGGKTQYFRELYETYKTEMQIMYERKLSVPPYCDEFYLGLFRRKHEGEFHIFDMEEWTLAFYDNEDLDAKLAETPGRIFLQPYKSKKRANTTIIKHPEWESEAIINLEEKYIFIMGHHDVGILAKLDETHYRVLWHVHHKVREILDITTNTITKEPSLDM